MAHILIAEHNPAVTAFISKILKRQGHSVTAVATSLDAWRATTKEKLDVLMVDVSMPGIDGFILAQRALQENASTVIIFITGFAAVAMDNYATPAFAPVPVTTQPFHLKQVGHRLHALLGRYDYQEESQQSTGTDGSTIVVYTDFAQKRAQKESQEDKMSSGKS